MLSLFVTIFVALFFSRALAHHIDPKQPSALWILILFTTVLLSVELLSAVDFFTVPALLGLYLLLGGLGFFLEKTAKEKPQKKHTSLWGLSSFFGVIAVLASSVPMAEIDSLAYHLPIVQNLVETHSAWDVFFAGFVGPNTYFPANHEALQAFFALQLGHTDLGFLVTLAAFALFYFSLNESFGEKLPRTAVFIFLDTAASVPFLFNQFLNLQVDLFLFSLFGSALCFLVKSAHQNSKLDLAKACLTLGLALGTKYNALPQVLVLLPFLLLLCVQLKSRPKELLGYLFLGLLPAFFWYARNAVLTQNPFYPFGLSFGPIEWIGHSTFVQETQGTSLASHLLTDGPQTLFTKITQNVEFTNELGALGLIVLLFALTAGIASLFFQKNRRLQKITLALLLLFFAEFFVYLSAPYTFTLWNQTIRYAAPLFAFVPLFFATAAGTSKKAAKWILFSCSALLVALLSTHSIFSADGTHELLSQKWALHGLMILSPLLLAWIAGMRNLMIFALCLSVFTSQILPRLKEGTSANDAYLSREVQGYSSLLPILETLRSTEKDADPVLAITGLTPYALFEQEGFETQYVNTDGCLACTYPDYKNEPLSIRGTPNEDAWKNALKQLGVDFLLISNTYEPDIEMVEFTWAKNDAQLFTLLIETEILSLYSINVP